MKALGRRVVPWMRSERSSYGPYLLKRASTNMVSGESTSNMEEVESFHKRVLPDNLVSLSSNRGKELFREALAAGDMESFFPLSEQFLTQSEPAFCALSSLAMVLNAQNHDPGKVWKGIWRWTSEETLRCESNKSCGHAFDDFKVKGVNFNEFESLASCHGVNMLSYRVGDNKKHTDRNHNGHSTACGQHSLRGCQHGLGTHRHSGQARVSTSWDDHQKDMTPLAKFRSYIDESCRSNKGDLFIIANFDREVLGQTGSGHFSPVGGYHRERDLVLIMDVARFKYPPWWVPVHDLWKAMGVRDPQTQESRGYFVMGI